MKYTILKKKVSAILSFKKGKIQNAVQVCYQIDDMNFGREIDGLIEAMTAFKLKEGFIVTFNQQDEFEKNGLKVKLIPAHEFLLTK